MVNLAGLITTSSEKEKIEVFNMATDDIKFRAYIGMKTTLNDIKEILDVSLRAYRRCS